MVLVLISGASRWKDLSTAKSMCVVMHHFFSAHVVPSGCRDISFQSVMNREVCVRKEFFAECRVVSRHGCVPRAGWAYDTSRTTRRWEWCDHEVLLVMSPVIQATGWRIVDTWVQLHLMLTFAYSGVLQQVMDITEMLCASRPIVVSAVCAFLFVGFAR